MTRTFAIVAVLLSLCLTVPARANSGFEEIQETHWLEAMRVGRIDSEILYAISLQESGTSFNGMRQYGPWPWTMNINEQGRYYSSRDAARRALSEEIKKGNNRIAIGIWQIYLRFNGHYVEDPLELIDPVTNLRVAALVLRECGDKYSTTREVLSCYHSGDVDEEGLNYATRVLKLAKKWGQPYRLRTRPEGVLYTHEAVDTQMFDSNTMPIANDSVSKPVTVAARPARTIMIERAMSQVVAEDMASTSTRPDDGFVQRVIVVE